MPRPYGVVVVSVTAGAVLLSLNNPTPCYNNTVDLICYYPDVMETVNGQRRYTVTLPSWRVNGKDVFPDEDVFDLHTVNQTASRLRVRIDPANFTGDPVSFTCYLPLTSGGEDSASTVVDPQEVYNTHIFSSKVPVWLFQAVYIHVYNKQSTHCVATTHNSMESMLLCRYKCLCVLVVPQ